MFLLQELNIEIRDKKGADNSVADQLSRIEREDDPVATVAHHHAYTMHLNSHRRHLDYARKDCKMMPNTTYEMIPTYGDFVMIKLFIGAFLTLRSIRSFGFIMQLLEVAIMDQLERSGEYLIVGSIGPPFLGTLTNSSPPTKNAKKLEWPLAEGMRCPNNPYCSTKSLMFGVSTSWGHSQSPMDYVSRWVEAIVTKTNDAKVVVDFLKSNIFCWFGVPKALISDQGSHFYNRVMSSLLHKYGVVHQIAIAYHLQTNSQSEVFNMEIKKTLQKMTNPNRKDWSRLLKDALWAHRTAYQTSLGMSPYQIVFGKLHSRWDGPFVITNIFPYGVVELKDEHTNNTFQVNGHQIKLFHEGRAPIRGDMETISLMEPAPPDDTP
ncbi:gag-pol, partial [Mucuna pruriens]